MALLCLWLWSPEPTQKPLCCSYLLLADALEEVRTQLEWREKGRHQAVSECLHLVLLRTFSLQFCSLSSPCRSVTFHQSCYSVLTCSPAVVCMLLFSWCCTCKPWHYSYLWFLMGRNCHQRENDCLLPLALPHPFFYSLKFTLNEKHKLVNNIVDKRD